MFFEVHLHQAVDVPGFPYRLAEQSTRRPFFCFSLGRSLGPELSIKRLDDLAIVFSRCPKAISDRSVSCNLDHAAQGGSGILQLAFEIVLQILPHKKVDADTFCQHYNGKNQRIEKEQLIAQRHVARMEEV